jgi:hypothetical protein
LPLAAADVKIEPEAVTLVVVPVHDTPIEHYNKHKWSGFGVHRSNQRPAPVEYEALNPVYVTDPSEVNRTYRAFVPMIVFGTVDPEYWPINGAVVSGPS